MIDLDKTKDTPAAKVVHHANGWRKADRELSTNKNSATKLAEYEARQRLRAAVDAAKGNET